MKHLILLFALILGANIAFSQVYPNKYLIEFTDKNDSPYSIQNPEEYLSQRALDRRERYGIAIDEYDLPVNPQYIQAVADIGVDILNPTKWLNAVVIYTTDPSKLDEIGALPFVKGVSENIVGPGNKTLPEESDLISLNKPFGMNEVMGGLAQNYKSGTSTRSLNYGQGYNQINMIGGIELHDQGYQGQGMVIAVLDGGFSSTNDMAAFDSLYMNDRILGVWDFVGRTANVYQGSTHGTAVLSTMGCNLPGQLIGTAPQASYYLLRTEDTGSEYIIEEYNWASGAEYADSVGADVINSSLSYKTFDDPAQDHTYGDMDGHTAPSTIAADRAMSRGMIVVNSAGNSGGDPVWPYIGAPADGDSVFTIGAVDPGGEYVYFSSIGPTADGRLKPNFVAQGSQTVVASTNGGVATSSGTSFSSPISAGMSACLWQFDPSMTNMDVLNAIQMSGSQANNPDELMGYGIPNFGMASLILKGFNTDIISETGDIDVFPNPFVDELKIAYNSPDTQSVSIQLYDITGKLLYARDNITRKYGLNYFHVGGLKHLNHGLYFLKIYSNNDIATCSLVIRSIGKVETDCFGRASLAKSVSNKNCIRVSYLWTWRWCGFSPSHQGEAPKTFGGGDEVFFQSNCIIKKVCSRD